LISQGYPSLKSTNQVKSWAQVYRKFAWAQVPLGLIGSAASVGVWKLLPEGPGPFFLGSGLLTTANVAYLTMVSSGNFV
jgi:hypothetical protein